MADKASATVKMHKDGRLYLPAQTRRTLEIYDEGAHLDLDVEIIERGVGDDE